jgi:hypothetical protein
MFVTAEQGEAILQATQDAQAPTTMGKPLRRPLSSRTIAAILSLLLLLVPFSSCFEDRAAAMDEGAVLVYPELVQKGAVPYRDFETFYGPANPWLLSAVYSRFGVTMGVERAVGLLYRMMILLAVFCIAQRWGTALAIGTTLLTGSALTGTGIVAYAWMGALACGLWYVWLISARNVSLPSSFIAGCLAGTALLFRVDLGPALVLASLPLLSSLSWPHRRMIALGGAIALLPLAVLFVTVGFEAVLNNLFVYPVLRSSPGRHIPLYAADPAAARIFFVHVLATLLNVGVGLALWLRRPRGLGDLTLLCVSLFVAGITHQAWQRLDWYHVLFAAFLSIGLLPISLMVIGSNCLKRLSNAQRGAGTAILTAVMVSVLIPEIPAITRETVAKAIQTELPPTFRVEKKGRWFPVGTLGTALRIQRLIDRLEELSSPGQRLFVGPRDLRRTNYCDTFLYHLTPQLRPATYFLEMNPFSANRPGSRLAKDIESADWLILSRLWDTAETFNRASELGSDEPNAVVRENFTLVGEYGSYALFRRKS